MTVSFLLLCLFYMALEVQCILPHPRRVGRGGHTLT